MIFFMLSGFRIIHLTGIFFGCTDQRTAVRQHVDTGIQRLALYHFGSVGNAAPLQIRQQVLLFAFQPQLP